MLEEILRDEDLPAVTISSRRVSEYDRRSHEDVLAQG